jgi:hypothetical protein
VFFSLRAWADQQGYFFPLLSDFWPHGEVAQAATGCSTSDAGMAPSAAPSSSASDGFVKWSLINGPGDRRDFSDLPAEVAALP